MYVCDFLPSPPFFSFIFSFFIVFFLLPSLLHPSCSLFPPFFVLFAIVICISFSRYLMGI
ncbi:hypothetical protein F5X96DRAFT_629499 [Biscogniauxia mediterranea]|nr:hypothetical protein F5X96DRAFT_629499 [Biscogniauxia mediterranea]